MKKSSRKRRKTWRPRYLVECETRVAAGRLAWWFSETQNAQYACKPKGV
jgi:hypothetical protein